MLRYHLTASGRVQGVGFRGFVQMAASRYPITGYVKNLYDETVEIEIQGESSDLEAVIALIRCGNRFVRVDHLEIEEKEIQISEKKFKIKY